MNDVNKARPLVADRGELNERNADSPHTRSSSSTARVSMVGAAGETSTRPASPERIIKSIRGGRWKDSVVAIREEYSRVLAVANTKAAKLAVSELKKALPGVMWCGEFSSREKPADQKLIAHAGLLCVDLDDLGERLGDVRAALIAHPTVWALFVSPTATGLKIVFRVRSDASLHAGSFRAAEQIITNLGARVDTAARDIGRLCFVSFDPQTYLNPNATELEPLETTKPVSNGAAAATAGDPDMSARRHIAERLLGTIDWESDTVGYCVCPGRDLHTTGDGERDCRVCVDGAPTAKCFHDSCSVVVKDINHELRSRIGRIERPPRGGEDFVLPEPAPWPKPPAADAFYGLAGEIVAAIAPHTEADPVAVLASLLAAFGSMAGGAPHFLAEARRHQTRIWPLLVGETAKGRKGSAQSSTRYMLEMVDPTWCQNRVQSGLSSGEGLIWAVRDPITKTRTNKDGTKDSFVEDEGETDKRLLCVEEEFSAVLKVAAREGNTVSDMLRRAWDDGNLRTLTKNCPARATGAHVTVVGHITKAELARLLTETDSLNGFGNRFLWLAVKRSRLLPEGGALQSVNLSPLVRSLKEAVDFARTSDRFERTPAAKKLWGETYPLLTRDRPGLLGGITNRAEAQVMRLALVYALLDRSRAIDVPHLRAGLAFWDYAERSAAYIFGEALGDKVADRIVDELRCAGDAGLTQNAIRDLFQRNVSAARIAEALATLVRFRKATRTEAQPQAKGRPAIVWRYPYAENAENAISPAINPGHPYAINAINAESPVSPGYTALNSFNALPPPGKTEPPEPTDPTPAPAGGEAGEDEEIAL